MNWKILLLSVCITPMAAWADRVWVEPVRGGGVADADRESVTELIRVAVPENRHDTVAASSSEADWTLSGSLMKLGDSYVLSLQKKDKSGRAVYSEKMKAATMSDMDTVATRLTRAVLNQASVESTADVTNITEQETFGNRRFNATRQWVVGLGPGFTSNLGGQGGGFTFTLGYLWGLDPDFSIDLALTLNNGPKSDTSSFTDFSLGGEYYFVRSKNSPYAGARMGYGNAHVNADKCNVLSIGCKQDRASGWAGTVDAGYKFFRTSTVNAAVFVSYTYIFDKTSLGNPSLTTAQFAVYF
jgi:hypothetical protein